jgi:hypothetical protein
LSNSQEKREKEQMNEARAKYLEDAKDEISEKPEASSDPIDWLEYLRVQ